MSDRRQKNALWLLNMTPSGGVQSTQHAILAVLMDLRDELQQIRIIQENLRIRVNCHETLAIPRILRRISANTAKPRKNRTDARG